MLLGGLHLKNMIYGDYIFYENERLVKNINTRLRDM